MIDYSTKPAPAAVLRPRLLIDTREKTPLVFSDKVDVEIVTMPVADYSVAGLSDVVAVERKSAQDLVHSFTSERDRFWECCRKLSGYEFRLLVVECALEDIKAKIYRGRAHPESIVGSTIAIYTDFGIPTLWAGSPKNAADMVERVLTRLWRKRVAEARAA